MTFLPISVEDFETSSPPKLKYCTSKIPMLLMMKIYGKLSVINWQHKKYSRKILL